MKLTRAISFRSAFQRGGKVRATRTLAPANGAFALPEMMIATGVFLLLAAAVLSAQLFGLRMFNLASPKLTAGYSARAVLNDIRDEIRSCQLLYVGNGNNLSFTNLAPNVARQGNALQIYPTSSTNLFVRYYLDPNSQELKRVVNGYGPVQVLAGAITNQLIFQAEDCTGNPLTNDVNTRIVQLTLVFRQWEQPGGQGGAASMYDYYYLRTTMTRRAQ